jgi:hypothetical protein
MMKSRMCCEPSACLQAVVTRKIIGNNEKVTCRILRFNIGQQGDIVLRVTRGRTSRQFLAIAHAQGSVHPGLLRSATVVQDRLDPVPGWRPPRGWRKAAGNYRPQFIGTDGRRPLGRLGVVADDRCPFGTKSGSSLVPQLCVRRQRTPSRKQMRRIWLRLTAMPTS